MSNEKSIPALTPETAALDAARRALSLRFETLREALGAALDKVDEDFETIHQLRVACRRATAAVDLFDDCMNKKIAKRARSTLRSFRRAAGDARDWDVWLSYLQKRFVRSESQDDLPGIDFLSGYCMAQRIPAHERIGAICPDYPFEFERWMTKIVGSLRAPGSDSLRVADIGRKRLIPQFESVWTMLKQPEMSWNELHEIRIQAKKLRYGIELLSAALPGSLLQPASKKLSELQAILGDGNDAHNGITRLEVLHRRVPELAARGWPRWKPFIKMLIDEHQQQMQDARNRFDKWKRAAEEERLDLVVCGLLNGASETIANRFPIVQAS